MGEELNYSYVLYLSTNTKETKNMKKNDLKSNKNKIIFFLIVTQILSLILIIKLFTVVDEKQSYPLGRQYLEYAFIADRYEVQILDQDGNDITHEFIEKNKKYYISGDWDKILENFAEESGNMLTDDKYDKSFDR